MNVHSRSFSILRTLQPLSILVRPLDRVVAYLTSRLTPPMSAADKAPAPKSPAAAQAASAYALTPLLDQRPAAAVQRQTQQAINASLRVQQATTLQRALNGRASATGPAAPVQRQEAPQKNTTGLPDELKAGVENLSGHSLDDVRVHYNSAQPAQLQAHAYAQGSDIHVAPGQEQHLPHEAWHVVQQKQGRVKPTMQLKSRVNVNDDDGLEKEADVMGATALAAADQLSGGQPAQVAQLAFGSTGAGIVQRDIDNVKYDESHAGKKAAAEQLFNAVNIKTKAAFEYAIAVPALGALADLNGYTRLWAEKWADFVAGRAPKLMAATFGYVVESLVSEKNSPYYPASPGGYRILTQVPVGGTRPDIVLVDADTSAHVAWVDLTASKSVDHIFDKDGWDSKVSMYAEVSYPSLDPGYMALMHQNKDNVGTIDPEVFKARVAEAKAAYGRKKVQWLELGKSYTISNLRSQIGATREAIGLDPSIAREFIRRKLVADFGADALDEKMVPSVLAAMGVAASYWGYNLGYAQSEKAGEAWLTNNDSALVPAEVPEVEMQ